MKSIWGGGSIIVGAVGYIRSSWADSGEPDFETPRFEECQEKACDTPDCCQGLIGLQNTVKLVNGYCLH